MTDSLAQRVRPDFPILNTEMNGQPLIYLDNGATTQKPASVIRAISDFYSSDNSNIHRGLYELSVRATDHYEAARKVVAEFLNANQPEECIFVRGSTEAINLVATSWGRSQLQPGDEVVVTGLEHHSNIVPWQMACDAVGAQLKVWYPDAEGVLPLPELEKLLNQKTRLIAVQHVSNALGTIHDIAAITRLAHAQGALVLVDGAQWVGHQATDVQALDCDFYCFSGHKLFAPTGIGVLWGRRSILESLPPYQGGGDMIETVTFENTTYAALPNRFEAGTPDIAGAIGLKAAIEYVLEIGFDAITAYETELLEYATERLNKVPGLRILGPNDHKAAVLSFAIDQPPVASIAPLDVASALATRGIAIRTGHHCCMPTMAQMQVTGTSRVSLAFYNTIEEIDALVDALQALVAKRQESRPSSEEDSNDLAEIQFAAPSADSVSAAAENLAEEFLEFDDRESKTELLMELGQELPDFFASLKHISTPVPGCMSEVYLVGRPAPAKQGHFELVADSNAEIVRGLIAVLQSLFSGQNAQEILDFDVEGFFRQIGLDEFVSVQRRSGLDGMIKRIRKLASTI